MFENLDKTLSAFGIFLALTIILLSFITDKILYVVVGIILLCVCIAYFFIGKRKELRISYIPQMQTNRSVYLLLNIIFFLILCYNIISLYFRPDPYVRPLSYFISIILMVSILTVEILFLPQSKPYTCFVLLKIILIPLSLVWSQMLIFPSLIGADPWWHQKFTQYIVDSGFIQERQCYSKLPVFHLIIGITSLVTGLDYKMSTLFSISSIQIICLLLFTFLLGRFIFNAKVGLLAALLLGFSKQFLFMSYWTIPNTLGGVLMLIIIYLLLKIKQDKPIRGSSLSLFFMVILIITHTISSMWLAVFLITCWAAFLIYERIYNEKCNITTTLGSSMFFIVAMLTWWMYVSGHMSSLVEVIKWGFSVDLDIMAAAGCTGASEQFIHNISVLEIVFNSMGCTLFYGIALAGCFYMISKRAKNPCSFNIGSVGMVFLGIIFFSIVSHVTIQVGRWEYCCLILLSIPLAVSLFLFSMRFRHDFIKTLFVVTIVAALCFSMIMTPTANIDNPLFRDTLVRKAPIASELQAFETISKLTDKEMGTANGLIAPPLDCFYTKDFNNYKDSIIIIKKEISQSPVAAYQYSFVKLDYVPEQLLEEEGFSCIYESGSVSAFCGNCKG